MSHLIQPLNGRVLLEPVEPSNVLIQTNENTLRPDGYLKVVAWAPDCKMPFTIGCKALLMVGANVTPQVKGTNLVLVHETSILAIDNRPVAAEEESTVNN